MKTLIRNIGCLVLATGATHAALPVVSNVTSSQRAGTKLVDIRYNVTDADGDLLKVRVEISSDGGANYSVPAFSLTGDVGDNISPGRSKHIVWDAETDWDGEYSDQMRVKVIASDSKGLPGLEFGNEIPAGGFLMGQDGGAEGAGPSKHVNIPWSYWLSKYEITNEQYAEYLNIALAAGELRWDPPSNRNLIQATDRLLGVLGNQRVIQLGDGRDLRWNVNKVEVTPHETDPVEKMPVGVTWWGALAFALHYGYDLPTTAEWEKAARGPDHDDENEHLVFPWGDTISRHHANYRGSNHPFNNSNGKTPVGYYDGNQIPVGSDMRNGYGLYDMVGNVAEWTRTREGFDVVGYPEEESLRWTYNNLNSGNHILRGGHYGEFLSTGNHRIFRLVGRSGYGPERGFRVIRREP